MHKMNMIRERYPPNFAFFLIAFFQSTHALYKNIQILLSLQYSQISG